MRKKWPYLELLWSAFSRIVTEYGEIVRNIEQKRESEKFICFFVDF